MPAKTAPPCPSALRSLPAAARSKAIEIVNALRDDGMREERAIRIAIAKARDWSEADGGMPTGPTAPSPPAQA